MFYFRADGNEKIAMGHVMRCLSIAEAAADLGCSPVFITADNGCHSMIEERGFRAIVLNTDYRDMLSEIPQLKKIVEQQNDMLLIDSYQADDAYFDAVKEFVQTACLEDMGVPHPACLLINYNIFAEESLYGQQDGTRLLLGTAYAPLREEFRGTQYQVRQDALRVLVTTGGSDRYQLAGRFLEKALGDDRTAGLEYGIVSGAFNPYLKELREWEKKNGNVRIYSNVTNMRELMEKSDIAVSAGGSTMYELSAVGVPTLCFSFVDNQEEIVRGFVDQGLVCFGGNYLAQGEGMLEMLVEKMALLVSDRRLRQAYSEKQRQMVDGKGAERIAQALLQGK